ncbi:response regulator [Paenibacillus sp. TRM 82003]|nr:response regulator [Paenibacillus sp. TRM 82003]
MLKAVVFDDEYIVLQGLRALIDWPAFGIELVGMASEGVSALAMVRELRPDIVMTDIRMPGMSGLELIETAMKEAPDTYFIVFSGFNEFEYVRQAIQLGVADYLDKPITVASIERAIKKLLEKFEERKQALDLRRSWDTGRKDLTEKAVLDLLLLGGEAVPKWKAYYKHADKAKAVTVAAVCGPVPLSTQEDFDAVPVRHGSEELVVMFHLVDPALGIGDRIFQEWDSEDAAIGVGRTYREVWKAAESYTEAVRALRSARLLHTTGIVYFDELGIGSPTPTGVDEWEETMILAIRAGRRPDVLDQIDRFVDWIHRAKPDTETVEREMLRWIHSALQAARESAPPDRKFEQFQEGWIPHVEIRRAADEGRLPLWFRERLSAIAELSLYSREETKYSTVDRAKAYIERNLTSDLSLQEVADHVGLNATYLSVLFKEVTGESYIKYVTRYRMEAAKSFLARGMKVTEVSEKVGYHTYRHFSEVFKKATGRTPGQYKEERGNHS